MSSSRDLSFLIGVFSIDISRLIYPLDPTKSGAPCTESFAELRASIPVTMATIAAASFDDEEDIISILIQVFIT